MSQQAPDTLKAAASLSSGDPGTGLILIALGVGIGYVTLRGLWPLVLLALFYPENLTYK